MCKGIAQGTSTGPDTPRGVPWSDKLEMVKELNKHELFQFNMDSLTFTETASC